MSNSSVLDPKTVLISQVVTLQPSPEHLTQILLDDHPYWAFANMYTYAGADVVIEAALDARPSLYDFHAITNMWLLFCPILIATFFLSAQFMRFMPGIRTRFRAFRSEERMVAVFHLVFTIAFAAKVVPQTYWTVHLLFGPSFAEQFNANYERLWGCAITNALLYVSEGVARSVIRPNLFLQAHHCLYFVFFVVPIMRNSVWGSKLILMLDCFIVLCELPLYIALLTHRFVISTRKVKVVTWLCMLWSVALRVLEGVILIAYFAGTYDRMKSWGQLQMWGWFLALSIPGGFITVMFSLGIFVWFIWKRDKNPDKYGPARYGLPERGPGALPVSQQSLNMGAVPSKYDP